MTTADEPTLNDLLLRLADEMESYYDTVQRFVTATAEQFTEAERRDAELRDDLHAIANRVESIFRCVPDESGGVRDADV